MNEQQIEGKAASLGFTIERDSGNSHYQLKDPNGQAVLLGSLKKIDAVLDGHLRKKAEALGLRLSAKKITGTSFDELSSGEARAVQREATTGYKIDKRVVIIDHGVAGESREQRQERAVRGGRSVEWVTVLGPDHTATLSEALDFLNNYAADIGLDDTDVDGGAALPMTESAASNPIKRTLSDAEFNEAIENHANANQIKATRGAKPRPGRDEQRRQQAIDDLLALMNSPVRWDRLSPEEKRRLYENYKKLKDEDERANDAKNHVKKEQPTWADLERREEQRRKIAFREADILLNRTNIRSRLDWKIGDHNEALINGQDPSKARQEMIRSEIKEWQDFTPPEKDTPDFTTPKPAVAAQVVTVQRRVSKADLPRKRMLLELAASIRDAKDPSEAGRLLNEAKTLVDHGAWSGWLKQIGISDRTARHWMANRQKSNQAA
jgi:hypothetical protein